MDTFLELLKVLLDFAGPIAVVVFGGIMTARQTREQKENSRIKELEKQESDRKEKELQQKFDGINQNLAVVNDRLSDLSSKIEKMEGIDERYEESLKYLKKQHALSWQYTHELAQLLMVLAAGMRDQHLDGNITKAIARCQDFEHKTLSQFMTTGPSDSGD